MLTSSDGIRNNKVFLDKLKRESSDFKDTNLEEIYNKKNYHIFDNYIIYTHSSSKYSILIKIDKLHIQNFLKDSTNILHNIIIITDNHGKIFSSNNTVINKNNLDSYLNNSNYKTIKTSTNDWHYYNLYPSYLVEENISRINKYTVILLLILFITNCIIIIIQLKLYNPVKEIINTYSNSKVEKFNKNEFDTINDIIIDLNFSRNNLLSENQKNIESSALNKLLHDPANGLSESIMINLSNKYSNYFVITNIIEDQKGNKQLDKAMNFELLIKKYISIKKIFFFSNIDTYIIPDITLDTLIDSINIIYKDLKHNNSFLYCGISNLHTDIKDIKQALTESITAIKKHSFSLHKDYNISLFSQIIDTNIRLNFSINKENQLISFVLNGEIKSIYNFFDQSLESYFIPLCYEQIKNTYRHLYDILQIIVISKELDLKNTEKLTIINFADTYNIFYIHNIVKQNYIHITTFISEQKAPLHEHILKYITKNHTKENLSLTDIADEFSISTVYLSSYFKKHSGININHYINNLKINTAKDIIEQNRNMTLQDVSQQVGYLNIGTFIRQFKKIIGTTPNQYKQSLHQ